MIHFFWLILISAVIGATFGCFAPGDSSQKFTHGLKVFFEFTLISFALGWLFYFLPF